MAQLDKFLFRLVLTSEKVEAPSFFIRTRSYMRRKNRIFTRILVEKDRYLHSPRTLSDYWPFLVDI